MTKTPKLNKRGKADKSEKLFDFPIKTFKDGNELQKLMINAEENTLFLIGEIETKFPEGDSKIELVWAKIYRTKD